MMMDAYTKRVQWEFTIQDSYLVSYHEHDEQGRVVAWIEERDKNGQEDCHEAGVAVWTGSQWEWQERCAWHETFDFYGDGSQQVLDFLNENPLPQEFFTHAEDRRANDE